MCASRLRSNVLSSFNATVLGSKGKGGEDEEDTKEEEGGREEKEEGEKKDKQDV